MREFGYLAAVAAMATIFIVSGANAMTNCPDYEPANVTHESDCRKYYKCHMGRKMEFECKQDNMGRQLCFVEGAKTCGRWGDCNCIHCKSLEDDHKWPDLSNEHWYYQCRKGAIDHVLCPNNEVFNPNTLQCQREGDDECPPTGSGLRFAHQCLCEKYYECKDGRQTLQKCDDGLLFDADTLTCRPKEDARCDKDPPHCLKDGAYPIETTCYYYYTCVNGVRTTQKCNYGMIFDKVMRVCKNWNQGTCDGLDFTTPPPNSCIGWERPKKPNPKDCNRYYECVNGIVEDVKCLENHYFNEKTLLCDLKKNVRCKNGGGNGGDNGDDNKDCPALDCGKVRFPHKYCEWYYECQNGKKVGLKCPSGLAYNEKSEMCDLLTNVQCAEPRPTDCEPGRLFPHECQCNMYYTCGNNDERILSHCPPGKDFDEVTLTCVPHGQATCPKEHKNVSFNQNVSHWFH